MLAYFSKDRRQARKLVKLAKTTIHRMERLLYHLAPADQRYTLIDRHLQVRRRQLERYQRLARGEFDLSEQLMPTLQNFDIYSGAMVREIRTFLKNADVFCSYLQKVKEP